jgi:hypothetical protein
MHFSLAAISAGACLLCLSAAVHFIGQGFQWRDHAALIATTSVIDPENPPQILVQKLDFGAVHYSNVGGRTQQALPSGFASYDAAFDEIEARYLWLKWPVRMCFVFGIALIFGGVVGFSRFFFAW